MVVQLEIPLETALHALAVARNEGVRTILNPAPAPREPIACEVDYLTPNETEAAGGARRRRHARTHARRRGRASSAAGACRRSRPRSVDTTGAGDAFTAAFAVALAEGLSDFDAVRWGCAAGAHMVEHRASCPACRRGRSSKRGSRAWRRERPS